eukprot:13167731-Alexandrium_andersonii.AAC.1
MWCLLRSSNRSLVSRLEWGGGLRRLPPTGACTVRPQRCAGRKRARCVRGRLAGGTRVPLCAGRDFGNAARHGTKTIP